MSQWPSADASVSALASNLAARRSARGPTVAAISSGFVGKGKYRRDAGLVPRDAIARMRCNPRTLKALSFMPPPVSSRTVASTSGHASKTPTANRNVTRSFTGLRTYSQGVPRAGSPRRIDRGTLARAVEGALTPINLGKLPESPSGWGLRLAQNIPQCDCELRLLVGLAQHLEAFALQGIAVHQFLGVA